MKKNLVAMLLAVGVIATATGCGSTESTSTTSTTEYVTEETTTEEAQAEETTEYVEEATEEVKTTEETTEEINVDDLVVKVREAMEATPYVVSDYTVLVNAGENHNYKTYYNKVSDTFYYIPEGGLPFWVDVNSATLYAFDESNNTYLFYTSHDDTEINKDRALNIGSFFKTAESSAVCTLDSVVDNSATVTINNTTESGGNCTSVMTINTKTGLIESKHYTEFNESGEVVSEVELELSYPVEGTPEYDELIQKATIPSEAIESANNQ